MILLTVGTQRPFDRLVRIVDDAAPGLPMPVVAQVGKGRYRPRNMEWHPFLGPVAFARLVADCSLIVSHAGIGTVVVAQRFGKPLILFPRRGTLGEHVNDHQLATVQALRGRRGIHVGMSAEELLVLVGQAVEPAVLEDDTPERARLRETVAAFLRDDFVPS